MHLKLSKQKHFAKHPGEFSGLQISDFLTSTSAMQLTNSAFLIPSETFPSTTKMPKEKSEART